MDKNLKKLLRTSTYLYSITMLVFAVASLVYHQYWMALAQLIAAAAMLAITLTISRRRADALAEYVQASVNTLSEASSGNMVSPLATVRLSDGEIMWFNEAFSKAAGLPASTIGCKIGDLMPGFQTGWITEGKSESPADQALRGRRYRVFGSIPAQGKTPVALLQLVDTTELLNTRDQYLRSRPVVCIILIDNYDELTNNLPDSTVSNLSADLNSRINAWAEDVGGLLRRLERNRFLFLFEAKDLYRITDKKFALLDKIREVVSPSGVAATISMGIGKDGDSFQEDYDFAALALEMALSRGGDQAVIKDNYNFSFYGGRARETERRTRVKARVMASSLTALISQSSRVFIMGHKNADADAIGAAAGLCAICRKNGKRVNIVANLKSNAAGKLISLLRAQPEYKDCFLSEQDALVAADADSLLIVVDTNRPDQVESLALLESMNRIAVIDHHRRAADYIVRAALSLHEPFASSASELVTELLTYAVEPRDILPAELEALLAGIVLDTKNFAVRVNSRTFEAAAFLRRLGADPIDVKKLFQSNFETTVARYRIIQEAHVYRDRIAVAAVNREISRVLAGQAADELLNIAGIETSFVLFRQGEDVYISGRSIGEINVQMVLEPLGGGGNAATAGAQIKANDIHAVQASLVEAIDRYFESDG